MCAWIERDVKLLRTSAASFEERRRLGHEVHVFRSCGNATRPGGLDLAPPRLLLRFESGSPARGDIRSDTDAVRTHPRPAQECTELERHQGGR